MGQISDIPMIPREYSGDSTRYDHREHRAPVEWNKEVIHECRDHPYPRSEWIEYRICDSHPDRDTTIYTDRSLGTIECCDTIRPRIRESRWLGYACSASGCHGTHHLYGYRVRQASLFNSYTFSCWLVYTPILASCSHIWCRFRSLICRDTRYPPLVSTTPTDPHQ